MNVLSGNVDNGYFKHAAITAGSAFIQANAVDIRFRIFSYLGRVHRLIGVARANRTISSIARESICRISTVRPELEAAFPKP